MYKRQGTKSDVVSSRIRLNNDYSEGAHPRILALLQETNMVQSPGYGEDDYCDAARKLIKKTFACPLSDVHFVVGGTQANLTVIDAALRSHQSVLSADTGHINVHETGAIEACGHKVETLPHVDGKITAEAIASHVSAHFADEAFEHMTQPKMVYLSQPTEFGTLYTKEELTAIKKVCEKHALFLFIDGARLGYGLSSSENDITPESLAPLCDVFTIGGTKVGALFGEGVVISHPDLKKDFRYLIKQKGGMLAKGRLLGLQFVALFEDGLYFRLGEHADVLAYKLRDALIEKGFTPYINSPTNQQFFKLDKTVCDEISKAFVFSPIETVDDTTQIVRFCTSWATTQESVDAFVTFIKTL